MVDRCFGERSHRDEQKMLCRSHTTRALRLQPSWRDIQNPNRLVEPTWARDCKRLIPWTSNIKWTDYTWVYSVCIDVLLDAYLHETLMIADVWQELNAWAVAWPIMSYRDNPHVLGCYQRDVMLVPSWKDSKWNTVLILGVLANIVKRTEFTWVYSTCISLTLEIYCIEL